MIGCATSGLEEEIPLPPTELKATVVSTNQVDLSWKDNSTNETAYKIERKTDSGNFSEIGSTSKDVTTFSDQTVSLNTTYTYRVYSTNTAGKSILYSNEATVKTISVPTLTTTSLTEVTAIGAKSGGNISSDGGSPITARGVVWSTEPVPTIAVVTKTSDGTGTGAFPSTLTGLNGNTKYYIRAYATNAAGTSYGEELSFTTTAAAVLPSITTVSVTDVTTSGAKTGGSITADGNSPITARGVVWGTATAPTIALATKTSNGSGLGAFVSSITGLAANTKYYVRAYATNSAGTGYGNEFSFTTTAVAGLPSITTVSVLEITFNSAKSGGSITADGNSAITAKGVIWHDSPENITIALSTKTNNGSGSGAFQSNMGPLSSFKKYYVRAYATNSAGTGYGQVIEFTTKFPEPGVSSVTVSQITTTSAVFNGNVQVADANDVDIYGFVWSTSPNPTIDLSTKTIKDSGAGLFQETIIGLSPGTKYYARVYAKMIDGNIYYGYMPEKDFTTLSLSPPNVLTSAISQITSTTAKSGGTIFENGGTSITTRGVVWSTSPNPTIDLPTKTSNGSGFGVFQSDLTGLSLNTKYYVRAYATNSGGTSYGQQLDFITLPANAVFGANGRVWMDRNLGASRVATSATDVASFGDLYQWGRGEDGHQKRTSSTTTIKSSADIPTSGNFITVSSGLADWRNPANDNLWQGLNGANNPCPERFRLPTAAEWNLESESWSAVTINGAFASKLKLPQAGSRDQFGNISSFDGFYWTSTIGGGASQSYAFRVSMNSGSSGNEGKYRVIGASVRCIMN